MVINTIFDSLASSVQTTEFFESLLDTKHVRIERIISTGQATPPGEWYDQEHDEWVMVLSGSAGLRDAQHTYALKPGDYVYIPAHHRHRVEWTDAHQPTIWLAVHITA